MSDFIFSSIPSQAQDQAQDLREQYGFFASQMYTFQGGWGSLASTRSPYHSFQPYESPRYIVVIIGAPVLCFASNSFLTAGDSTTGTRAIFERYRAGTLRWDVDLSGPFAILLIDKHTFSIECITDLMMFIPVYRCLTRKALLLGTHEDALAARAELTQDLDSVSIGDFILHDRITHPYTLYKGVTQLDPSSAYRFERDQANGFSIRRECYWKPYEAYSFRTLADAAATVRESLEAYLARVTQGMHTVAQFLSAGEDSRVIAALLPDALRHESFIFVDGYNREQAIAQRVADACRLNLNTCLREPDHYFKIMPEAMALVGSGHQYQHAHTAKLGRECRLDRYPAVFGGHLADVFLKGYHARLRHTEDCSLIRPASYLPGESRSLPITHPAFKPDILEAIRQRRIAHLHRVQAFRNESAHEWFTLWPASMLQSIGSFYCNRRLFRAYEPFMSNAVVKASATIPTAWKLRRRLFHRMARTALRSTKRIPHGDGWYPYHSWRRNAGIFAVTIYWRRWKRRMGIESANQGAWVSWDRLVHCDTWKTLVDRVDDYGGPLRTVMEIDPKMLMGGTLLTTMQKVNLLQLLCRLGAAPLLADSNTLSEPEAHVSRRG